MKPETKVHYLRLDAEISKQVSRDAKANRRSVSSEIAVLVEMGLKWREENEAR